MVSTHPVGTAAGERDRMTPCFRVQGLGFRVMSKPARDWNCFAWRSECAPVHPLLPWPASYAVFIDLLVASRE